MKKKKALVGFLVIFLIVCVFLTYKSFNNREVKEILEENKIDRKGFAVYTKEDGEYEPYVSEDSLFPDGYILDIDASKCYNDKNEEIKLLTNILIQNGNSVTVKSNETLYCTLYFYKETIPTVDELIDTNSEGQIQDKPVDGDNLKRFQGSSDTVKNNYICFGTSDKNTCTTTDGQSKYMYRIIGIDTQTNQLKIIKKEALDTAYQWHSIYGSDSYTWNNVMLFKQLNGIDTSNGSYPSNIFLTNETYVPNTNIGSSSTKWSDAIENHTWSYADVPYSNSGVYEGGNATQILANEKNAWTSGSNHGTIQAKIGLMYVSDYYLAVSNTADCRSNNYSKCKSSWIFITNNDDSAPGGNSEWTMSPNAGSGAWLVSYSGSVGYDFITNTYAVRPVFYLRSQISLEGDGSIGNPYRIVSAAPTIEKVEVTNDNKSSFTVKVTAGDYATRYCYKLDTELEYKCTNTNTNEFTNVNDNTNYTISVYVENKNGLRSEVKETLRIPLGNKVVENSDHGNGGYGASGVTEVTDPLVNRFYGTDPNNYICFGANTCENNSDYMYRIIGATNDGKLKVIKQTKLSNNQYWHTSSEATWDTASLRSDINDSLFYNNPDLVREDYKKYIDPNPSWCIGEVTSYSTGSAVLQKEMTICKTIENSPIGIMNLSDYYFAYNKGAGLQRCSDSPYCKSWMTSSETQWTISRTGSKHAWYVGPEGGVSQSAGINDFEFATRPVFYLVSNIKLSGSGKADDPFIITGLAS